MNQGDFLMLTPSRWKVIALSFVLLLTLAHSAFAANWKNLAPANAPSARLAPIMAYDPVSQKIVLFGGVSPAGYLNDTWTFDGTNWTQMNPATVPPGRTSGNMTYDRVDKRLVLFGGYAGNGVYLKDTWLWDGASSNWVQTTPAVSPTAVTAPLVFTDPKSGHAMTWGGYDGHLYQNVTWIWTGRTWKNLQVQTSPFARSCSTVGFDPVAKTVLVFDGLADGNPYNTWTWDGTQWTLQNPTNQPPARYCGAGAYDAALNGVVAFGGGIGGPDLNDTWLWTGGDWQAVLSNHNPPSRESAGMAFDAKLGHVILFGGLHNSKTLLGDTWELLP
jgi:galactose oxidase-like protein